MKKILLLILPILVIVTIALTVFGIFEVRSENEKLMDDLYRRSKNLAESMELSVRHVLQNADKKNADYLVEKFQNRERFQGCVIYDREGKIFAITERFTNWSNRDTARLLSTLADTVANGAREKFNEYSVYSYMLPVLDDDQQLLGIVEVIYDTSYVATRIGALWKRLSMTLIILIVGIFILLFFIQRQIFFSSHAADHKMVLPVSAGRNKCHAEHPG